MLQLRSNLPPACPKPSRPTPRKRRAEWALGARGRAISMVCEFAVPRWRVACAARNVTGGRSWGWESELLRRAGTGRLWRFARPGAARFAALVCVSNGCKKADTERVGVGSCECGKRWALLRTALAHTTRAVADCGRSSEHVSFSLRQSRE